MVKKTHKKTSRPGRMEGKVTERLLGEPADGWMTELSTNEKIDGTSMDKLIEISRWNK